MCACVVLLDSPSSSSMSDLDKEIAQLRGSLREAQSELEYQKNRTDRDLQDLFVVVMDDFMKSVGDSFSQLEGMVLEMKERVGGEERLEKGVGRWEGREGMWVGRGRRGWRGKLGDGRGERGVDRESWEVGEGKWERKCKELLCMHCSLHYAAV